MKIKILNTFMHPILRAQNQFQFSVEIPYNKIYIKFLYILKENGFIYDFEILKETLKKIRIFLRYYKNQGVITCVSSLAKLKLFSKIKYKTLLQLTPIPYFLIVNTQRGIMTHQEAIKLKLKSQILFILF